MTTVPEIQGIEIEGKIGQGGMATVWKGRQLNLDRPVAIKVLHAEWGDDPSDIERFKTEARSAARLKHASIIQVHDANFLEGTYYIVMEFIDGYSVGDWLRRKGTLTQADALLIAECVADGLLYAWKHAKMIHCDIKPDNIMVDRDGTLKIADLGLARTMDVLRPSSGTDDDVLGTPAYMSPEQARGASDLDCRADIYSLGCMLYHILTGKFPFEGMDVDEVLAQQIEGQLPDVMDVVSGVSKPMCALLQKMMAKDRDLRQADWHEVLQDIHAVRHFRLPSRMPPHDASTMACSAQRMGGGGHATGDVGERVSSKATRRLVPAVIAVGAILAMILGVVLLLSGPEPQPMEKAVVPRAEEQVVESSDERAERDAEARQRYEAALDLFENNPADFDGAMRLLNAVVASYSDTRYGALAGREMERISALRERAAERVVASLHEQAAAYESRFDFDRAIQIFREYDGAMSAETVALRRDAVSALHRRREMYMAAQQAEEEMRQKRVLQSWETLCRIMLDDGVAAASENIAIILENDALDEESVRVFEQIGGVLRESARLHRRVLQSFERERGRAVEVHLHGGMQRYTIVDVDVAGETVTAEQEIIVRGHRAARMVRFSIHDLAPEEYRSRAGGDGDLALGLAIILEEWTSKDLSDVERSLAGFPAPFSDALLAQMRVRRDARQEEVAKTHLVEGVRRMGVLIDDEQAYADWVRAVDVARGERGLHPDAADWAVEFEMTFENTQIVRDAADVLEALKRSAVAAVEQETSTEREYSALQVRARARRRLVTDHQSYVRIDESIRRSMVAKNPDLFVMDIRIMREPASGNAVRVEVVSDMLADIGPLAALEDLEEVVCAGGHPDHVWRNRPIAPLRDLSPLRGLLLAVLNINNTAVRDLTPLLGMPLLEFNASHTQVADISALRNAPLEVVLLRGTSVRDLSPLRGKPLRRVDVSDTAVIDFRPLAGDQLTHLDAADTQLRDLTTLYGAPIERLNISGSRVFNFNALRDMPLVHLEASRTQIRDLAILRGKALVHLSLTETSVNDISVLAGMPLVRLHLGRTTVSDCSVLASLPLEELNVSHTRIVDLSFLSGLPLRVLNISHTRVRDLSPLEGLPLRSLNMVGVEYDSLSPLAGLPIERLSIDNPERANVRNLLHRLPNLRFVNGIEWVR